MSDKEAVRAFLRGQYLTWLRASYDEWAALKGMRLMTTPTDQWIAFRNGSPYPWWLESAPAAEESK